jgi:hypothetical protein
MAASGGSFGCLVLQCPAVAFGLAGRHTGRKIMVMMASPWRKSTGYALPMSDDWDSTIAKLGGTGPGLRAPAKTRTRKKSSNKAKSKLPVGGVEVPEIGGEGEELGFAPAELLQRKASIVEVYEWVAANMAIDRPSISQCPAPEAWGMLKWARSKAANETAFWSAHSKMLPTGAALGAGNRFRDDGEALLEDIDKMLLDIERKRSERARRKGIPATVPESIEEPETSDEGGDQ